jgi:hypothetical protein
MARATGMAGRETLVQAYGLREIVNGIGLLVSENPRTWLWGRLAGDTLDLSTLATNAISGNPAEREREAGNAHGRTDRRARPARRSAAR